MAIAIGRKKNVLPGFSLTLGLTITYLSLIVLIPLAAMVMKASSLTGSKFIAAVSSPEVLAAFKLSFGASAIAAAFNGLFGLLVAWVLARYSFPGKRFIDGLVDLPFALPTAVAGITLTTIYAPTGWIGQYLDARGIKVAFEPIGIVIALIFIGIPFVVRTVQPVIEELDAEVEEASASLGASRLQTFRRVIAPTLIPPLLTGFAMAFARALGEYGSVVFISGNLPMKTEIVPLTIMSKLEQYDVAGATAIAALMLSISFSMLFVINALQAWSRRKTGAEVL